ncbi:Pyridoxal-dependent decarboxylase conserved domain-containing protein [Streptomyces sp. DvalAA-14]|uniref:pyridoxal phosphate-dependent decarboxylase family protein n=1 Tax=Streptomyces sp. DvalAA-14 TaxID=1839759 RepID=UPI00081B475C|nr:Pyridoxal-dependent decarboxylase conserved domain-containing protein [Streptomyces sp. DvalAA-14]
MDPLLAGDLARLPELLGMTREYASRFLAGLAERPVVRAGWGVDGEAEALPAEGRGLEAALAAFGARWEAGLSGAAGPRYLGFVTGGATPAGLAGDWLTAAYDQNAASGGDSCAAALEKETLGWLRELFGLSEAHSGAFVSGATVSNTVGLAVAREWVGSRLGVRVSEAGAAALGPVDVLSGTPHSSIGKALSMLGMGRERLRTVATLPGREAVDVDALAAALAALDGRPAIVVANAGTVNTVDFDDLRAIAALRDRFPFWLHVDAAFGGFAALSPAHAHLTDGLDLADSVCVDLHKWLNVPYDSAVQFTRRRDLQTAVFHNSSPYLGAPGPVDPGFPPSHPGELPPPAGPAGLAHPQCLRRRRPPRDRHPQRGLRRRVGRAARRAPGLRTARASPPQRRLLHPHRPSRRGAAGRVHHRADRLR